MGKFNRASRKVLGDMPEFLKFFIPTLLVMLAGATITATLFTSGLWWVGVPAFLVTFFLVIVVYEMGMPD